MGYTTTFEGEWKIEPALTPEHRAYLKEFSEVRHMDRDVAYTTKRPDPLREAVGLPLGVGAGYFVNGEGFGKGERGDPLVHEPNARCGILDGNKPPAGQPGLWCKWEPNENGTTMRWSGIEKFYDYEEWIQYLMDHFLTPWGYKLSGRVDYQGENEDDKGFIMIYNGRTFLNEDPVLEKLSDAL
jgi:hypothetical protein